MTAPDLRPLIVGSGIAGLYVALRGREAGLAPTIVTKSRLDESNTRYAQGGIAAALGPDDSPARHLADTTAAGDGLVDPAAARILTDEAPRRIADLVRFGVPFDTADGQISLGREAAHSRARIVHAGGDATGFHIEETLRARVLEAGIDIRERTVLARLTPLPDGALVATLAQDGGGTEEVRAAPVVLATGGAGGLYRHSSNPAIATGDGFAVAFRAGALLADMEFIQFHPTAFARPGAPRYLITEALRGEGAKLVNAAGERFLPSGAGRGELAPRDVLCRAIRRELDRSGADHVYLDATGIPRDRLDARFPTISRFLATYGLDLSRDPVPVAPAAHYTIGGVATDLEGRTSLPGLLAVGEVASTGVHGANRLASNSLLEGLVFGERAVRQLRRSSPGGPLPPPVVLDLPSPPGEGEDRREARLAEVQELLWADAGILRSAGGLAAADRRFAELAREAEPPEGALPGPGANAVVAGRLIVRAALAREESRGAHYRVDFPRPRATWRHALGLRRSPMPSRGERRARRA